ncbi:MGH1-like glycoside hydrolase domain-containing protein [Streptomyces sp. AF1B]|uniref:MGH1-like glycoside hydrolase domain-containing protein n=1 Tax=Streptomyces sp. AF1B TaxID=3399503 RepID=UPI003AB0C991
MAPHQMPRRHFLGSVGAAGLGSAAIGLVPGAGQAEAAPSGTEGLVDASGRHRPELPYPTLRRPFAMPGVKEQDWTGALFVGTGESRFALRVGLLTAQGKLLREKMTNYLWRIGPMAPDGAYKEVQVTTDDRTIMPAHLEALREVIAHPDQWSQSEVDDATAKLPQLQQKYDQVQSEKRTIRVRYARTGDGSGLVGAVTALDDDTTVVLELSSPWGELASYAVDGSCLAGSAPGLSDTTRTGHVRLSPTEPADSSGCYASVADMTAAVTGGTGTPGSAVAALVYRLGKGRTITFAARVDDRTVKAEAPEAHKVERTLAASAHVRGGNLTGSGPVGRAADAVRDALSLNTNYDRDRHRNFVMWGWGGGGGLFTGWDSAFDAVNAALVSRTLALQHETDVFEAPAPPNQVPLLGPRYDQQNSGPMHAYAAWRLYTKFGDRSILEKTYPALVTFHDLLPEWDTDRDGLLETPYFGDRVGGRGNHLGLDDSPVYADYHRIPKQGGSGDKRDNTDLTDVALNSYYALLAETLAKMARVLDRPQDAQRFAAQHATIRRLLNDRLWHAEKGLYLSRYLDGTWNEVVTPTVFYPLFAGIATPERARVLVEQHLLDPREFWGEYVVPSVARNDPAYCSGGPVHPDSEHFRFFDRYGEDTAPEQWKGAVWPPMNATVYDGVKRYGFDHVAGQFAARSAAMYLDAWDKENWFPESFDPEPGQSIMDSAVDTAWRTYSWSNAMAVPGLHELISDNPWDGDASALMFGTLSLPGTNTVANVQLRGHTYAVSAGPDRTTLVRDGRTVFRATGARVAVRNFVLHASGASFDINADGPARIEVFGKDGRARGRKVPAGRTHVSL